VFVLLGGFFWIQTIKADNVKLSGTGIFGDPSVVYSQIVLPRLQHTSENIVTKLIHNKMSYGVEKFAQNYLNAFSPDFLFVEGAQNHAHNIKNFGNMYLVDALFFFVGLAYLFMEKKSKAHYLIL